MIKTNKSKYRFGIHEIQEVISNTLNCNKSYMGQHCALAFGFHSKRFCRSYISYITIFSTESDF